MHATDFLKAVLVRAHEPCTMQGTDLLKAVPVTARELRAVQSQARAPKITVDLDVHIDGDEFKSSYDSSLQPLVKLPPNVKVSIAYISVFSGQAFL